MKRNYFGTDGIRGEYGGPVMNEAFATRLGAAVGAWLKRRGIAGPVLIGRDTRFSGESLERALAAGLRSGGLEPHSLGVLPTPAVSRAVRLQGAALGVVITASHNPAQDNGIKFFRRSGSKLDDNDELEIEALLPAEPPKVEGEAAAAPLAGVKTAYVDAAAGLLPAQSLQGWKVILDTANGAAFATSPAAFRKLGADIVVIGDSPDGRNINAGVGSEHPEQLAAMVKTHGARIGVAHDGDGDRCVLCDETGSVLDGDEILTILATHALGKGTLPARTLVVTVQSNLGVDAAISAAGGQVLRTAVGDRYVSERMTATGATLGGESSGHIICAEVSPTGDGLVAALKVIDVMRATGRPLSELRRALQRFPQRSVALKVKEKKPLETLPRLSGEIAAIEKEFAGRGRVLVRYSGTESKIRLLVEGPTDEAVDAGLARLRAAVEAEL